MAEIEASPQLPPDPPAGLATGGRSAPISSLVLDDLLDQITDTECTCTPFIGAGASRAVLGSGRDIAKSWSEAHGYPFPDTADDLSRVAQYLAVTIRPATPKRLLLREFATKGQPDFGKADEPHRLLAELPFPVYITTNYDDFMMRALESVGKRPTREYCRWNSELRKTPSVFDDPSGFVPTIEAPVVFHIHGHVDDDQSLVLTEDDYLDFISEITARPSLIPPRIMEAIRGTTLLFVGYKIADWDIRLILRSLVKLYAPSAQPRHVAVQTEPRDVPAAKRSQALAYLEKYFDNGEIAILWTSVEDFTDQLRKRWEALGRGG